MDKPIRIPYIKPNINCIERVQNRFLKFIALKFKIIIDQHDITPVRSLLNLPIL